MPLLVLGTVLYIFSQCVRTLGWYTILRASYPDADELRRRDVVKAYLAGSGLNAVIPARGGDAVKLAIVHRHIPGSRYSTLIATFVPETLFETAFDCPVSRIWFRSAYAKLGSRIGGGPESTSTAASPPLLDPSACASPLLVEPDEAPDDPDEEDDEPDADPGSSSPPHAQSSASSESETTTARRTSWS